MLEKHTKRAYLYFTDERTTAVDCTQLGDVLSSLPTQFGCSTIQSVEVILIGMLEVCFEDWTPFKDPLCASHNGI